MSADEQLTPQEICAAYKAELARLYGSDFAAAAFVLYGLHRRFFVMLPTREADGTLQPPDRHVPPQQYTRRTILQALNDLQGQQPASLPQIHSEAPVVPTEQLTPLELCAAYTAEIVRLHGEDFAAAAQVEYQGGWFYVRLPTQMGDGTVVPSYLRPSKLRRAKFLAAMNTLRQRHPEPPPPIFERTYTTRIPHESIESFVRQDGRLVAWATFHWTGPTVRLELGGTSWEAVRQHFANIANQVFAPNRRDPLDYDTVLRFLTQAPVATDRFVPETVNPLPAAGGQEEYL